MRGSNALLTWLAIGLLALLFIAMLLVGGPQSGVDRSLIYHAQMDPLVPAARVATRLGDWWLVLIVGAVGAAWLALRRRWRSALLLAGILVSERLLVEQLKLIFDRTRPDPAGHLIAVHSMAFPSGHAANAMALGLAFALLIPASPRARRWAVTLGLVYAFAIGVTRLILGVHWPSDVIGGWALGAAWTLLLVALFGGTSPREPH